VNVKAARLSPDGKWAAAGLYDLENAGRRLSPKPALGPKPEFDPAETLFTISAEARAAIHSLPGFDVSADGGRFAIPLVSTAEGPSIVVVQNWEGLVVAYWTGQRRLRRSGPAPGVPANLHDRLCNSPPAP
jgi:hypothetical protein